MPRVDPEIYRLYRNAIEALKIELGYQDVRKHILTQSFSDNFIALDTNFRTKGRVKDTKAFIEEWYPKVEEAFQHTTFVIGTITVLPQKEGDQGHYMCIAFSKSSHRSYLYDPSNGRINSNAVHATNLVKAQLKTLLEERMPLTEIKTPYAIQVNMFNSKKEPIHADVYCQTWSLLMAIGFVNHQDLGRGSTPSGRPIYSELKARHDLMIEGLRTKILPHMNKEMLEKTFQGLHPGDIQAYDILMGTILNDYTFLFFRDTPYSHID